MAHMGLVPGQQIPQQSLIQAFSGTIRTDFPHISNENILKAMLPLPGSDIIMLAASCLQLGQVPANLILMEKYTLRVEVSSDSDDSISEALFSAEERALPDDLLKNSKKFIKLHKEHLLEFQETIRHLKKSADDFLDKFEKSINIERVMAILLLVSGLSQILMVCIYGSSSRTMEITCSVVGFFIAVVSLRCIREAQKEIKQEIEEALKKFNLTADQVMSHLKNICSDVERILQYQNNKQSLAKWETKGLRKHGDALSQLAELFKPEELQGVLQRGKRALDEAQNLNPHVTAVRCMLDSGIILSIKNYRMRRDFSRLKNQERVQENEVESKVGRFIWKTREMINHLQTIFYEISSSKTAVEKVIIPKLNQYFKQQREAQTDENWQ
ncbi:hypothetical protein MHYP_G00128280 [Metynnis hypsauchen]